MVQTGAQRKAALKYKKEKTKSVTVTFYPSDMELYEYLETKPSKATYIKELIKKEMGS